MRKITFTVEDRVIERAYKVERSESKTLEAAFYDWLILYAYGNVTRGEIEALFRSLKHVDAGRKFTRDAMNER